MDRWDDALIGPSFSRWFDRTTNPKEHVAHRAPCASDGNINDHGHAAAPVNLRPIVSDIMVDVAVQQPLAGVACGPDNVVALARPDEKGEKRRHVHDVRSTR